LNGLLLLALDLNPRRDGNALRVLSVNQGITTACKYLNGICNYFINQPTNGGIEEINHQNKLIKQQAYDFINFDNFRLQLLTCFSN